MNEQEQSLLGLLVGTIAGMGIYWLVMRKGPFWVPMPRAGDTYILRDADPFTPSTIRILEVKGRWVQYSTLYFNGAVAPEKYSMPLQHLRWWWRRVQWVKE